MSVSIITALTRNHVIGINNQIPWHIPDDFRWFRQNTLNKPVVMGRKTFESIGRILPQRRNIVVTSQSDYSYEGIETADSLLDAFDLCGNTEVMVIGGASIYQQALPYAQRLYLTWIYADVEGDAYFPKVKWSEWHNVESYCYATHRFTVMER